MTTSKLAWSIAALALFAWGIWLSVQNMTDQIEIPAESSVTFHGQYAEYIEAESCEPFTIRTDSQLITAKKDSVENAEFCSYGYKLIAEDVRIEEIKSGKYGVTITTYPEPLESELLAGPVVQPGVIFIIVGIAGIWMAWKS